VNLFIKKHYKNISLVQIKKQLLSILFWLRDPFSIFFYKFWLRYFYLFNRDNKNFFFELCCV